MADDKSRYDIFICGGTQHFVKLQELLPLLHPFGTVHLVSIVLTTEELELLKPYYDVLHHPHHHEAGYRNFELFCIREINRLASAPHFIKLDADIYLRGDWVEYVAESLVRYPDAVLFGPDEGCTNITVKLSGPLVEQKLGRSLCVREGRKVTGGFYVGQTDFFRRHDPFMQTVHRLLYYSAGNEASLQVTPPSMRGSSGEDVLRNLVVHARGAGDRLLVLDSAGRVQVNFDAALA